MRYDLNIASRPFVNLTVPALVAVLLGIATVAFSAFNATVILAEAQDVRNYDRRIAEVEANVASLAERIETSRKYIKEIDARRIRRHVEYSNDLIERRTLDWTQLFNRLENLIPAEVRMLRIAPNTRGKDIVLRFSLEVRDFSALDRFVAALERSPYFADITPISQTPGPSGSIQRWELEIKYRND